MRRIERKHAEKAIGRLLALWLAAFATTCLAQDFPSRPVQLVVPFAAGSTADVGARALGEALRETWKEPVIVVNKAGAGGTLGSAEVARARADGHTLSIGITSIVLDKVLHEKLPYDPERDLQPITLIAAAPMILAIHPSVPGDDLKAFIAHARENPKRLSDGSTGRGTLSHLMMELLKSEARIELTHVLYDGNPRLLSDLLGGHIHATVAIAPAVRPLITNAKLKAVAITGRRLGEHVPDVRTFAEQGFKQIDATAWMGLLSPTGVSGDVAEKLSDDVQRALRSPKLIAQLSSAGFEVVGGTSKEFKLFLKAELDKWTTLARASGVDSSAKETQPKALR